MKSWSPTKNPGVRSAVERLGEIGEIQIIGIVVIGVVETMATGKLANVTGMAKATPKAQLKNVLVGRKNAIDRM